MLLHFDSLDPSYHCPTNMSTVCRRCSFFFRINLTRYTVEEAWLSVDIGVCAPTHLHNVRLSRSPSTFSVTPSNANTWMRKHLSHGDVRCTSCHGQTY